MIKLYLYPIDREIRTVWADTYKDAQDKVRNLIEAQCNMAFNSTDWLEFCDEVEENTGIVLGCISELSEFEDEYESRTRY